ncbi:molybdopterin oxidoreductase family protein [Phycicoccus duodecadis]|uniref:Putative molibdopterin-dependent oxidoreductase YjgC n=1 Tax=Phycicoccus duodecadis TaxID=173053 RepID=A0A2N3YHA3_9MICO|nr:molybdopterin oxidoreductase family protein [Phycicoccus duodecadis]PKW26220.1 putative molibdopterin-dependent oxidoreductase YjgC [Phycicoccus duodecadis]
MTADRIADVWGTRTPMGPGAPWPQRVDQHLVDGLTDQDVDRWVQSACVLCSNGCGLDIAVRDDRMVGVRGRADDRVSHGRLGPKGLFGWQGQSRDRLLRPMVRRHGKLEETTWEDAMGVVVSRSRELLESRGPLSHAFYTSGQLMIEEYYTLAVIGKAGLGTPHMDGNTRLCTATAAAALKETFGTDGQPGSYTDLDHADAVFHYGHNVAETQTVLWARMLDRLEGSDPPRHVCVDPRRTAVAQRSDVHLAVRPGTNLALMNGLLREVIHRGWVDEEYVAAHTRGFDELVATVEPYTPSHVADICRVSARDLEAAAEIFGTSERIVSTVLQGFYQSHQATAASCQVNNLHLLRGMLGRPGAGILQMNGQPTAQNNRETGVDGDLSGFRNWENESHVRELAELWDVDPMKIPHWAPPTHAMQIMRYVEQGSIGLLWVAGTNPAVSLPDLERVRRILSSDSVLVVVNESFPNETTELADVVLPAALWGEKTGTFTNVDRTVHLSEQAVRPPGEARSDLDIWVDYARRMDLRDRSGRPIPRWETPEDAFDGWRDCSRGRPCDYSGMSYELLRGSPGIQWPCTEDAPTGTERIYTDHVFNTQDDYCETYGHDLLTGASTTPEQHRAARFDGRARLKAAEWTPAPDAPDEDYPLRLGTGRTVYHFHTRTKTGRAPELDAAAPEAWVEISPEDAEPLGVAEGDIVRVESRRGAIEVPARIAGVRPGAVFVPFHYGDVDKGDRPSRAANELTMSVWDPVSKQPAFKGGAVRVTRVRAGDGPAPAPPTTPSPEGA